MFCFALFLRQALSVPYAGLSHLWVSGLQWNIPNSTIYLGRPKSPSCPSVPGSEIGTQARLQSSRRLRTEQERRCSSPSTIGHRSQSTCFWLHRAGGSWPGVSHHLVSRDGDSAVEVALPRAAGPLGKDLRRARGNFLTPKVVQEAPLHISPKNWLKWCPKGLLQKEPIYSLKIKYIDFHLIINYKSLESTENLYREIKISN